MTTTTKVHVVDYSLRGDWVFVAYPGGRIRLPKEELNKVPDEHRDEVFGRAKSTCEQKIELLRKAWSYEFFGSDWRRHTVSFIVRLDRETKPRTLEKKVLRGEFFLVLGWWIDRKYGLVVVEHDRVERDISYRNTENLGSEDIPDDLVDEIIAATEVYLREWSIT